ASEGSDVMRPGFSRKSLAADPLRGSELVRMDVMIDRAQCGNDVADRATSRRAWSVRRRRRSGAVLRVAHRLGCLVVQAGQVGVREPAGSGTGGSGLPSQARR